MARARKDNVDKKTGNNTYCIICGNQKAGIPVGNDYVLDILRGIKRAVTKKESNKGLVVCRDDYGTYEKYYKKFRFRLGLYLSLGIIFSVFSMFVSPSLTTAGVDIFIIVFLYALAMLNYTPHLALDSINANAGRTAKKNTGGKIG